MEISVLNEALEKIDTAVMVITVFEDDLQNISHIQSLNEAMGGKITHLIESGEVKGKYREFTLLHTENMGPQRVLVMGLGKRKDFNTDKIRSIAASSARYVRRINAHEMAIHDFSSFGVEPSDSACAISEGIILGQYRFEKYKEKKKADIDAIKTLKIATLESERLDYLRQGAETGCVLAKSTNFVRDLVNEPACFMTPTIFAEVATQIAQENNLKLTVLDTAEMEKEGMGALLGVAKGSVEPPKLVVLEYNGNPNGKRIGIVGKGVTFDSGGYDIKPSNSMYRMYGDMAGAAATLGAISAIAQQKLPVNVVGVMALAENLVSERAYKPGDILKSMSGKTIEILNTDAEGRLLLADAMTYIRKYHQLDALVDIATLTGAAIIALGRFISAILGNNKDLIQRMFQAGEGCAERVWELPLYDEFRSQLVSDVADIENIGGRSGGTITAAAFLKEFAGDGPWIHVDIAGTSMMEEEIMRYVKNPYLPKEGGTGTGTRLLYHFVKSFIE